MLYSIIGILIVLWLIGIVTSYTMGGLIHLLIVVALAIFLINLLRGSKA